MRLKNKQLAPLLSTAEIIALKRAVELISNRSRQSLPADARLAGEITVSRRGQGMDLVDIRAYQLGDDVKAIDWHTTAKRGRPYIKVFEEESESETCLFVQQDADMLFATRGALKITVAAQCATILTFNAKKNHSPLSGMRKRQTLNSFRASLSDPALFQWVMDCSQGFDNPIESNITLVESFHRLEGFVRYQAHIIVICNKFQDMSSNFKACFIRLRQQNRVTVIQIIDPIEVELPKAGSVLINIPGQGNGVLNTDDSEVRQDYFKAQEQSRKATHDFFKRIEVNSLFVFTHKNVLEQLLPLL